MKTLSLIEALNPSKIIPGHLEQGWEMDAKADLAHNKKYLELFAEKIMRAQKKPGVDEIYQTFKEAFPQVGCCALPSLVMAGWVLMEFSRQTRIWTSSWAICRTISARAARFGKVRFSVI